MGTDIFDTVTLNFEFGLLFENFNLLNNFSTGSAIALAFHRSISGDKIFFSDVKIFVLENFQDHLCFQTRLAFLHFVEVLNTRILPAYCLVQVGCLSTV